MKNALCLLLALGLTTGVLSAKPDEFKGGTISTGVVVSDVEASVKFYTEVVGMTQTGGFKVPGEFATKLGLSDGHTLDVTVLKLQDSPDAAQWKLMSFGDMPKAQRSKHITGHLGMQYITVMVTDLAPFVKRIKAHDVELLSEGAVELPNGNHFVLIQDPDGVFIELIGPME